MTKIGRGGIAAWWADRRRERQQDAEQRPVHRSWWWSFVALHSHVDGDDLRLTSGLDDDDGEEAASNDDRSMTIFDLADRYGHSTL